MSQLCATGRGGQDVVRHTGRLQRDSSIVIRSHRSSSSDCWSERRGAAGSWRTEKCRAAKACKDSQVARDGGTRRYLGGHVRCSILIGVAKASRVYKAKGFGVVQKQIEYRPRVEHGHLIEIAVFVLEGLYVRDELSIVVIKSGRYLLHRSMSLFENKRCAVGRRNSQEEE